jgi:hypothetical protein
MHVLAPHTHTHTHTHTHAHTQERACVDGPALTGIITTKQRELDSWWDVDKRKSTHSKNGLGGHAEAFAVWTPSVRVRTARMDYLLCGVEQRQQEWTQRTRGDVCCVSVEQRKTGTQQERTTPDVCCVGVEQRKTGTQQEWRFAVSHTARRAKRRAHPRGRRC